MLDRRHPSHWISKSMFQFQMQFYQIFPHKIKRQESKPKKETLLLLKPTSSLQAPSHHFFYKFWAHFSHIFFILKLQPRDETIQILTISGLYKLPTKKSVVFTRHEVFFFNFQHQWKTEKYQRPLGCKTPAPALFESWILHIPSYQFIDQSSIPKAAWDSARPKKGGTGNFRP